MLNCNTNKEGFSPIYQPKALLIDEINASTLNGDKWWRNCREKEKEQIYFLRRNPDLE